MLQRLNLVQSFYLFVSVKDPKEKYDWRSTNTCACGQYITQMMGVPVDSEDRSAVWALFFEDIPGVEGEFNTLNTIAMADDNEDWTFGKLRKRLEERVPECVV